MGKMHTRLLGLLRQKDWSQEHQANCLASHECGSDPPLQSFISSPLQYAIYTGGKTIRTQVFTGQSVIR